MANDIKDFGDYSVKNVKNFMGMDTYGFNCTLYRGKKKIAFCIDDGNGGEVNIDFGNPPKDLDDKAGWEKYRAERDYESKLLKDHLATLPKVQSKFGDKSMELTVDQGWFVTELVNQFEKAKEVRKVQRQCQDKTLFRTPDQGQGQYYILKTAWGERVKDHIHQKYGKDVEIFNEVFEKGEIPSVVA
jgi:hypothetical protein